MEENMVKSEKKKAFTLSETLITLTIIAVIAVITIPVISGNYRREEASSRIKKFYAMLNNAATRSKADGKDWADWAETGSNASDVSFETVNNFSQTYLLPYINYNKVSGVENPKHSFLYVYLDDGTYFILHKGACLHFRIDVNGMKKPNKAGRDIFGFLFCSDSVTGYKGGTGRVIPYMSKNITTRDSALNICKNDANQCSGLLWFDNWEFKKDYPYNI